MDDFDRLCREQEGLVYRYLLSLCRDGALAEELTAETFYRAYLHIGSFRGECRVETWLCGIARSAFFREQKRRKRLCPQEEASALPARDDLLERFHDREQALAIHRALHRLKEPGREVFTLRVLGELSFQEIAAVFSRTESWAKMTFYRAKAQLIQELEETHEHQL